MRKIILYICFGISAFLLLKIIAVLSTGLSKLTDYGYGYLTGSIILFLVFIGIIIILLKKQKNKSEF